MSALTIHLYTYRENEPITYTMPFRNVGEPGVAMSHSFVGFEVSTAVIMKSIIFWDMTTCSQSSFNRRYGRTYRLYLQGRRNKFSKKPASKQLAICSSETSVDTQRTTRRHMPEDDTFNYQFRLPPACLQVFAELPSSTLKMEAMFLRNVGWNSRDYAASYPRRWCTSHNLVSRPWDSTRKERRWKLHMMLWHVNAVTQTLV
jgi:hypothetical protein